MLLAFTPSSRLFPIGRIHPDIGPRTGFGPIAVGDNLRSLELLLNTEAVALQRSTRRLIMNNHLDISHCRLRTVETGNSFNETTMLYYFPDGTYAIARTDYEKPYDNPVSVKSGDVVRPAADGTMETDYLGWTWCTGPDGRVGWVPDSWCEVMEAGWQLRRDFSALEFTIRKGDRLRLILSESGFLFAENESGDRAWIPDAVMESEDRGAL